MEAGIASFEWKRPALEGRALLGAAPEAEVEPLMSPVSPDHDDEKTKHSLVAALTVIMVVTVGAIFCCCYQWDKRLRGHIQAQTRSPGHAEMAEGTLSSSISLHDSGGPSISVIMPGDDIPRFVAWAAPQGVPVASDTADARVQPEPNQHVEKIGRYSVTVARNSWIPGRVSG